MLDSEELDELKSFLAEHIEDMEELIILSVLRARAPEGISLTELANSTPFPIETTRAILDKLTARRLTTCFVLEPAEYRFAPPDALREPFERALAHYRSDPLAILMLLSSNAIDRVRTAALRTFADAFRIKGPKSNG